MKTTLKVFDNFINKYVLDNITWHKIKFKIHEVKYILLQI